MTIKQLENRQQQILASLGAQTVKELTERMNPLNESQKTLLEEYNSIRLILSII